MRPSIGADETHATLLGLELLAVPASVLAAGAALLLATGAVAVVRFAGALLGVGETTLDLVASAIVLATFLLLVSLGGAAVVGYRHVLEERFDDVEPIPTLAVPIAAIAVTVGYVAAAKGTLDLPQWAFAIVAIASHALAFRAVALDSVLENRPRLAVVVGALAAVPAALALVTVVDGTFWSGTVSEAMLSAADGTVPLDRSFLVAVPLAVTALYGVARVAEDDGRIDLTEWEERLAGATDRLADATPDRGLGSRGSSSSSAPRRTGHKRRSVVPSSPKGPSKGDAGGDSSSRSRSRSRSRSGSRGGKSKSSSSGPSGASRRGRSKSTEKKRPSASAGSGASSRDAGGTDPDASADEGTGSDTRIFAHDFGDDADEVDETPVEVCPDCDEDIPSDGVYKFCPFCGCEL
ncbi:zinc ribbon domain-containing protein [Salinilacihabitans rarus]|uniref:zinc ribbon domain-containing protein n=1 Tax=Salinilacihabitans rarus TaxID=2961596 RepID=UPI0020C89526|nr:zinc ribbon domain-containing protein [Salinilacihabitans rarus]